MDKLPSLPKMPSDETMARVITQELYEYINAFRVENGLKELRRSATLDRSAAAKAQHMLDNGYFGHWFGDIGPRYFAEASGYGYPEIGENCASSAYGAGRKPFYQWQDSPGHRANMLHPDALEMGLGIAIERRPYTSIKHMVSVQHISTRLTDT